MKKALVMLIGVALLIGFSASSSAEEFEEETERAFAVGMTDTTDPNLFFLIVLHVEAENASGETEDWRVSGFVAPDIRFDVRVPDKHIDIEYGSGRASVNTYVPGVGKVLVAWQATGEEREEETHTEEPESELEFRYKPANNVSGTIGDFKIGSVIFGRIEESEYEGETL